MKMSFLRKKRRKDILRLHRIVIILWMPLCQATMVLSFPDTAWPCPAQHGKGSGARKRHNAYEKHGTNGNLTPYVKR